MVGETIKLPTRRFCGNRFPKKIDQFIAVRATTLTVKMRHCDIARLMLSYSNVKSGSNAGTEVGVVSGAGGEDKDR